MIKKINKKIIALALVFLFSGFQTAEAANLFLESNGSNLKVGDIVAVSLYVNADGEPINSVEGVLKLTSDVLEIQSISTAGSILNLWVEQPAFSGNAITFNGGIPNPGYSASKGKIITIFMKAIKAGSAIVDFQSASVRANDGMGTDVLNGKYNTTINVAGAVIPSVGEDVQTTPPVQTSTPSQNTSLPSAPVITSSEIKNSDDWFSVDSFNLSWTLPKNIIAVKTLLGKNPDSDPTILYSNPISSKKIEAIDDGTWYFHIKYQNDAGWGKVTHKKIKIDNSVPKNIEIVSNTINENGLLEMIVRGQDSVSGIAKFIFSVDGQEKIEMNKVEDGVAKITFPPNFVGEKELKIEAVDNAGNSSGISEMITFPSLKEPVITSIPEEIKVGEKITIEGQSEYPNTDIELKIVIDGEEISYTGRTSSSGSFTFTTDAINNSGKISAMIKILFGADGNFIASSEYEIEVSGEGYLSVARKVSNVLSVFVPIVSTILILILVIYVVIIKFILISKDRNRNRRIKKIRKETMHVLNTLRENTMEDIKVIKNDKNLDDINEAEKVLLTGLIQEFKHAEKALAKRVQKLNQIKEEGTE